VRTQRDRAHEALERHAWIEAYDTLRAIDPAELGPDDLEALGDAAWWTSRLAESIAVRQRAYAGYAAAADDARAGFVATRLCIEHFLLGEPAVAGGWLMRAQRHLGGREECDERTYLDIVESNIARFTGDPDRAISLAGRATAAAERSGNRDLLAMAIHSDGLAKIASGRIEDGLALLDEAMTSVLAGELTPYYTGAVFCNVLEACLQLADLGRASQWSDAAVAWGESLPPPGALFPGLCRVNRAEVAQLRGDWDEAVTEAERAIEEVSAFEPAVAAPAYVTIGDVRRRRGELAAAEAAYTRARELGHDAQPGRALLRLAQGNGDGARDALRLAIDEGRVPPLRLARLVAAQVQAELAGGDVAAAEAAAARLGEVADAMDTPCVHATAAIALGTVALATGRIDDARRHLADAAAVWQRLRMPYETALAREAYGRALREAEDEEDARLELAAAYEAFDRLGAAPDADRVRTALDAASLPGGLTAREVEVLRLVASGKTNRTIATELVISEHTVARHLQNLFAKLDVSSRSAATAWAFEHRLA